ncbi:IclR family transcriptional regulator [Thermobaculum terrenum]|nr:IclR family transcriptional regulator [Thermobaculum terrenum]
MNQGDASTGQVKSAARVLDLLELLAEHEEGLTLTQICRALRIPKSSAHALIRTLLGRGYLAQGFQAGTYRLGPRTFEVGSAYMRSVDLIREGQEIIRQISRRCGETTHLATLDGQDVIYVAKEEGNNLIRMVSAVGKRFPAHGTAVGKMLLSGLSRDELLRRYPRSRPLPKLTENTITDPEAFYRELEETRARGYALDHEESTAGLCCVAAPVYDAGGRMVAAMSISVPRVNFTEARLPELLRLVREGAAELSTRLGYLPAGKRADAGVERGREVDRMVGSGRGT